MQPASPGRDADRAVVAAPCGEPDVVRMIERGDRFAAVELDREFRRQLAAARFAREHVEQRMRERAAVDARGGIVPGKRAQHHVADVVAGGEGGAVAGRAARIGARAEPRVEQRARERIGRTGADAAQLEIRAVGRVERAGAVCARGRGDRARLLRIEPAAGQLDPAQPAVGGRDDAHEPRASRRAHDRRRTIRIRGGTQRDTGTVSRCGQRVGTPRPTPTGTHALAGRQVSWLTGRRLLPAFPEKPVA